MGRNRIIVGGLLALLAAGLSAYAPASAALPPQRPATTDSSVAYQIDPAHTGNIADSPLTGNLVQKWSVALGGKISYPLIVSNTVYVTVVAAGTPNVSLYALDANSGSTLWGPVAVGTRFWANAAYDNGQIFTVNFDGNMQAFNAQTGVQNWSIQIPVQYVFTSPPTAVNGMVYTGGSGSGGNVYAVSEANGTILWTGGVAYGDHSSPAVSSTGVYVTYPCQNYDFNPTTGVQNWHTSTGCTGGGGRTPVLYNGRLYVRDEVDSPTILDASTGTQVGTFNAGPAPAFDGNTGFYLSGNVLTATNLTTGNALWSFTGDGTLTTAPVIANGRVYMASSGAHLYALDEATGAVSYSTTLPAGVAAPDEHNAGQPLTGLGGGDGLLVVPSGNWLSAYVSPFLTATSTNTPGPSPTATSTVPPCGVGTWTQLAPVPTALYAAAVVAQDGLIYSFGGTTGLDSLTNAYKYNPATDSWTTIAALPQGLAAAQAVSDGMSIYIVGGGTGSNVITPTTILLRYNPATDTYTSLASSTTPTYAHAAVYLNGKIYRIGGRTRNTPTIADTSSVEVYTIATNSWSSAAVYPLAAEEITAVGYNNYIYTLGGASYSGAATPAGTRPYAAPDRVTNFTAKAYRYDPATDSWDDTAIADIGSGGCCSAGAMLNGRWIVTGGYDSSGSEAGAVAWNPVDNTWTLLPAMLQPEAFSGAAVVGNAFYNVGGLFANLSNSSPTNANQRYIETPCATATGTPTIPATASATVTSTATSTGTPTIPATASTTVTSTATSSATPSATVTPTATSTVCTVSFSDVGDPTAYYYQPVAYLACHGVISGYADGSFRPYNNTTRGQMSKIVVLAYSFPIQTPAAGGFTFADVPPASTFFAYVETAATHNIISGYPCGHTNPQTGASEPCDGATHPYYRSGNNVTRGQLAKIVVLAATQARGWTLENPTTASFSDVPAGSTFYEYIETAVCHSVLGGYNDGTFRPDNNATRGQISKIVYFALGSGATCGAPATPPAR